MTLVDTSIWIETFRRGSAFELTSVVSIDQVVTCLPVVQEVLQGFSGFFRYLRDRGVEQATVTPSI